MTCECHDTRIRQSMILNKGTSIGKNKPAPITAQFHRDGGRYFQKGSGELSAVNHDSVDYSHPG